MKLFPLVLLLLALSVCTGCGTLGSASKPAPIQKILNATLPPTFTGYASFVHKNPYIDITITADGLKRGEDGLWTFTWLKYKRNGRVSHGDIVLGTPPREAD